MNSPSPPSKRVYRRLEPWQKEALVDHYASGDFWPDRDTRENLANRLGITQRKIQVWFQNERVKSPTTPPNNVLQPRPFYASNGSTAPVISPLVSPIATYATPPWQAHELAANFKASQDNTPNQVREFRHSMDSPFQTIGNKRFHY